ncbi:hypothetical protein INT48_009789 [Thamnidium elegans]|uniref:LITAF domain-containing protein n=1 Tax=Thamnidium elegans TaxID=101142 RepID=A0A8H7VTJ4_9FUNG|nr:hypothetical protein INT48_009789 [Thamnidium elegans]
MATHIHASSSKVETCDIIQDQQDLCSVHSARNQIFYFSTPLPTQKHEPYQYHGEKKKNRASSIISTGRQTIKSWRQKRLNILPKKYLPHVETEAYCSHCEKYITTRIRYKNGTMVWLISFIL